MFIIDFSIIYPIVITFASIFYSMISQNLVGIYFAFGNIILGFIANTYFKQLIKYFYPKYKPFLRPNPPKIGCGEFPNYEFHPIHSYGMPSGHAQMATLAATFWIFYLLNLRSLNMITYIAIFILIFLAFMVSYSRVYIGCHNMLQVLVGSFIGFLLGILLYIIWRWL